MANDALRTRMVAVEVTVLRDGCQGTAILYEQWVRENDMPVRPPKLGSGTFAFRARAIDETCVAFAVGCEEIKLPSDIRELNVVMATQAEQALCSASECNAGICADALDAGIDSGNTDAGPRLDSGSVDSGPDAGPDACTLLVETCDGINNDCDSQIDEGCCTPPFALGRIIGTANTYQCYSAKQTATSEAQAITACANMGATLGPPPVGECGAFHDGEGQQCYPNSNFGCGVGPGVCRTDGGVQGPSGCSTCSVGASVCPLSCTQPYYCVKTPLH